MTSIDDEHIADVSKKVEGDCISRQMAIDTIMGQPPEPHYPSWYAAQVEKLPAVQPETATVTIGRTKGGVVMWYERGEWLKGAVIHLSQCLHEIGDQFGIVNVEVDE